MALARLVPLSLVFLLACSGGGGGSGGSGGKDPGEKPPPAPPARSVSPYEVEPPYLADPDFWSRSDIFILRPDHSPPDLWPDEVQRPADHGIRIIVLLPGDYRGRSNGRLDPGVLYIESSGTAAEPLLVVYAPEEGADVLAARHPAERMGESEARLTSIRVWNQDHQYFHGLTFRDGIASSLLRETTGTVIDRCLWHETAPQPIRIRFGAHHNLVQRCVMRRFDPSGWGAGDTVAIQLSDGACTHNRVVSNVVLNYTDSYQHTDRDGEDYGLGAGTIVDNNFMGFTPEAYRQEPEGELMCGENAIDMKMGGTAAEPVRITNNVFFGVRAAKAGCGASGSGGYAVTLHRRGTFIEMSGNLFLDLDSGIFLNSMFLDADPSLGRIDPRWTIDGNTFSGIRSRATAFPDRTGRVLSGLSPATFTGNRILEAERLMEREPVSGPWELSIRDNEFWGVPDLFPRDRARLEADGNEFHDPAGAADVEIHVPWSGRKLRYRAAP